MSSKLRVTLLAIVLLMLSAALTNALAQPFTWSKAGSRPQDYDMGGDPTVAHGAANPGFVKSKVSPINGFGTYLTSIAPGQYRNQAIKLSAYVKTVNAANYVGMWMRVDGAGNQTLSFDNMATRPLVGTNDWEQYEVILDVPESSTAIFFGILINGTGEAYIDGLQVEPAARTWIAQNTGITQWTFALRAIDENTVWAGAQQGVYLRTTDGGATWNSGTVPGATTLTFNSIAAIDQNTAYFTGQNFQSSDARIYKTTDGGLTWTQQYRNTGAGAFFNSIAFWDATHGLATSDPVNGSFLIVTTADGGTTWNQVPAANIPTPSPGEWAGVGDGGGTTLTVEGANNAWFGNGNAAPVRVFKTTDQGRMWSAVNTPNTATGDFKGITTVAFKDALNGFAGSTHAPYSKTINALAKTTDGGQSWTVVIGFLPKNISTLLYVPQTNNQAIVVSSLQGFSYSSDGGETWKILNTQPCVTTSFASANAGWTVDGNTGKILKFAGNFNTAVSEQPAALPEGFHLAQNYPNPFSARGIFDNPSTTIQYKLPQAAHVQLAIYNLLGEKVRTLVDAKESAGLKQITWDGRNDQGERVSSGMYLYRMEAGEFRMVKRLVLMK
jgi:photosystem II stability/assembly factor-like uncharacterized protein